MTPREDRIDADRAFRLGPWQVRPATNELVRGDEVRRVEHKAMQLLVFLVRHAGRDLSRDEILEGVWGEGVHNEEVVTVAVSTLRKALDDDARSPRFIKTVPRHGYRLLLPADGVSMPAAAPTRWERWADRVGPRFLIVAGLVGLLLFVLLVQVVVELVYYLGR